MNLTFEVISKKFYIRYLILFFVEKRKTVFGDSNFTFSVSEFEDYIRRVNLFGTMGHDITKEMIVFHLKFCKTGLYQRDNNLCICLPRTPLLSYSVSKNSSCFTIKHCETEYLSNALRDIDIALELKDWTKSEKGGNEDENENENENENEIRKKRRERSKLSLFKQEQDHRVSFLDQSTHRPLGNKERALFETLVGQFKRPVSYKDLFRASREYRNLNYENLNQQKETAEQKKEYVNSGINELRKKLFEISRNPEVIVTTPGRESSYSLVY